MRDVKALQMATSTSRPEVQPRVQPSATSAPEASRSCVDTSWGASTRMRRRLSLPRRRLRGVPAWPAAGPLSPSGSRRGCQRQQPHYSDGVFARAGLEAGLRADGPSECECAACTQHPSQAFGGSTDWDLQGVPIPGGTRPTRRVRSETPRFYRRDTRDRPR